MSERQPVIEIVDYQNDLSWKYHPDWVEYYVKHHGTFEGFADECRKQLDIALKNAKRTLAILKRGGMMSDEEKPLSEKVSEYDGGDYWITAAIWRTRIEHNLFDTYEIGMRNKTTGEFWLLQGDFNYQTVQEVAKSIAHLLAIRGEYYTPEWCKEHFK